MVLGRQAFLALLAAWALVLGPGAGSAAAKLVAPGVGPVGLDRVECPTARQCTAAATGYSDTKAYGQVVTYDPRTNRVNRAGARQLFPVGYHLSDLACPSVGQCYVLDGNELVPFNPRTGRRNGRTRGPLVGPRVPTITSPVFDGLACPSVRQCSASGTGGSPEGDPFDAELTFDPRTGRRRAGGLKAFDQFGSSLEDIVCPSTRECVVNGDAHHLQIERDAHDLQIAFDPRSAFDPRRGRRLGTVSFKFEGVVGGPVCPSDGQCTSLVFPGRGQHPALEYTADPRRSHDGLFAGVFDPTPPGAKPLHRVDLVSLDCPTTMQCTVVDRAGGETTFVPRSGRLIRARRTIQRPAKGVTEPTVACPTTTQCTVVTGASEVSFNPLRRMRRTG